ncbi:MAG: GAF domain-containing protein [Candidatus Caenarcaniphilales bacterium]|nr:GAF domain-containing protein [Candidatus Caenarcaniphilales bacterium]
MLEDVKNLHDKFLSIKLRHGLERLGLETGIVSRIKKNKYKVIEIITNISLLKIHSEFDLKDTFCTQVVKSKKTVFYTHVGDIPELRLHPVYRNLKLESYIGTPIFTFDDNIWGTLNFSSLRIKDKQFPEENIKYVEEAAHQIQGYLLKMDLISRWD